jgi:hypothetical protein
MPLESAKYRLTKWSPEKVIIGTHDDAVMILPEDWAPQQFHIRLIACRNLCKRVLQKQCTIASDSK